MFWLICVSLYLEPVAVAPVAEGHRLTDEAIVPLEEDDREQKRALLAGAASKRAGFSWAGFYQAFLYYIVTCTLSRRFQMSYFQICLPTFAFAWLSYIRAMKTKFTKKYGDDEHN